MKVLVVLACVLAVAVTPCWAAAAAAAAQLPSMPLVPGLQTAAGPQGALLGRGYDPIYMQPRGPVMSYTYENVNNNNNQWTDPEYGSTFHLPDEISLFELGSEETQTSTQVFTNFSQVQEMYSHSEWSSFSLFFFSFSQGTASAFFKEEFNASSHMISYAEHVSITRKMSMWPTQVMQPEMKPGGLQANNGFLLAQQALPTARSSAEEVEAYSTFIEKFGTHYAATAFFGGSLQVMIVTNTSLAEKYGHEWVEQQASFGIDLFFIQFSFSGGTNHSTGSLAKEFKENSQAVLMAFGGNPGLVAENNLAQWAPSIHLQPVALNVTYEPVEALFTDPTKAALFKEAATEYLDTKPKTAPFCAAAPGTSINGAKFPSLPPEAQARTDIRPRVLKPSWDDIEAAAAAAVAAANQASNGATASPQAPPAPPAKPALRGVVEAYASKVEDEVKATEAQVHVEPIPALDSGVGRGYDAKNGRVLLPVYNLNYNESKLWFDPLSDKYFAIPNSMDFASMPSVCFQETMTVIENATAAWNFLAESSGFSLGVTWPDPPISVGVGFSQQMSHYKSLTKNYTRALTVFQRYYRTYSLGFGAGNPELLPTLQQVIDMLPETPSPAYRQVIQYWGTHYVARADMGGYCNFTVAVDKSYMKRTTKSSVAYQVSLSIGFELEDIGIDVDLGFGFGHATGHTSAAFNEASNSTYACIGGDVINLQNKDYAKWAMTVQTAPAFIPNTMQLRSISELIYNPTKRALMTKAIVSYLNE